MARMRGAATGAIWGLLLLLPAAAAKASEPVLLNLDEVVSANDYPLSARRSGIEGTTRIDVLVGTDGLAESCRISQSSGNSALDEQSCALFRARARFTPARDSHGRFVEGHYTTPITWRLEGDENSGLMPRQAWLTRVTSLLNAKGKMVGCSIEATGIVNPRDPCAAFEKSPEFAAIPAADKIVAAREIVETQFVPVAYRRAKLPPLRTDASLVGRQVIRLEVKGDGDVLTCEVVEASGQAGSDNEACQSPQFLRFVAAPGAPLLEGTVVVTAYLANTKLS